MKVGKTLPPNIEIFNMVWSIYMIKCFIYPKNIYWHKEVITIMLNERAGLKTSYLV